MKDTLRKYLTRFTTLDDTEQAAILNEIKVAAFPKGTVLLRQGEAPRECFFVIKGCIRQYAVDEAGREITSNFYTEEQAVMMLDRHHADATSKYTYACVEDCELVVGDLSAEQAMYAKHGQLGHMTRRMIELNFASMQEEFAAFVASSPEERFASLLRRRPGLIDRVPQHQLASYLGMTPESLSRIKKRLPRL